MTDFFKRLGPFPMLLISFASVITGGWLLITLVNNTWVLDPSNARIDDFRRNAALGNLEAAQIMQEADMRLIGLFLLGVIAVVTGVILPLVYLINARLRLRSAEPQHPTSIITLIRQALWVGAWAAFCVYLHMTRTFGVAIAILLLVFFALLELLLILRTRADFAANAAAD